MVMLNNVKITCCVSETVQLKQFKKNEKNIKKTNKNEKDEREKLKNKKIIKKQKSV